jgi:hypothetical protein
MLDVPTILVTSFIVLVVVMYFMNYYMPKYNQTITPELALILNQLREKENKVKDEKHVIGDIITERDIRTIYDPMVPPHTRIPRNQFPPDIEKYKYLFEYPTRGYPDNYQLMGALYREADEDSLQLFGRETYPGSTQYEYYVITGYNGSVPMKIPLELETSNLQLFDGDTINVPTRDPSKGPFKYIKYQNNTFKYNPFIF